MARFLALRVFLLPFGLEVARSCIQALDSSSRRVGLGGKFLFE